MFYGFDVQAIMREIKNTYRVEGDELSARFLQDYPDGYIPTINEAVSKIIISRKQCSMDYLTMHRGIPYYREIDNQNRVIAFAKRVIRKAITFCIKPMVEEQNCINDHLFRIIQAQNQEMDLIRGELNELKKTNDSMEWGGV